MKITLIIEDGNISNTTTKEFFEPVRTEIEAMAGASFDYVRGLQSKERFLVLHKRLHELPGTQKIVLIKLYREATGVGLKEAKDTIEGLEQSQNVFPQLEQEQTAALLNLMGREGINASLLTKEELVCHKIHTS